MHIRTNTLTLITTMAGSLALGATAVAQDAVTQDREFGESSPYYEDDAWYDISEWFDGNDYNPTDEAVGRWDDETYDSWEDMAGDKDNDNWFGFDKEDKENDWFYDYYDTGYTWNRDENQDSMYERSGRFIDRNNDGYYDVYWVFIDSDKDGYFDRQGEYEFNQSEGTRSAGQVQNAGMSRMARAMAVEGEIKRTKKASVHGTEHMLVELEAQGGRTIVADLGPVAPLRSSQSALTEGRPITVHGALTQVGDKSMLAADRAVIAGRTIQIDRSGRSFSGTVQGVHETQIRGESHVMAVVKQGEKNYLVDLGPSSTLQLKPSEGQKLSVQGVPVRAKDGKVVVFATGVGREGTMRSIDRPFDLSGTTKPGMNKDHPNQPGNMGERNPRTPNTPSNPSKPEHPGRNPGNPRH